jgi:hypothetical protein
MIYRLILKNGHIDFLTLAEAEAYQSIHGGKIVEMKQDYKPDPEPVIPQTIIVAAWQLRLQLTEMGLKDQVETAIYALPEPDRTRALTVWEYGNTIKQDSPLIDMISKELKLTEKEVTDIFQAANNIIL